MKIERKVDDSAIKLFTFRLKLAVLVRTRTSGNYSRISLQCSQVWGCSSVSDPSFKIECQNSRSRDPFSIISAREYECVYRLHVHLHRKDDRLDPPFSIPLLFAPALLGSHENNKIVQPVRSSPSPSRSKITKAGSERATTPSAIAVAHYIRGHTSTAAQDQEQNPAQRVVHHLPRLYADHPYKPRSAQEQMVKSSAGCSRLPGICGWFAAQGSPNKDDRFQPIRPR